MLLGGLASLAYVAYTGSFGSCGTTTGLLLFIGGIVTGFLGLSTLISTFISMAIDRYQASQR